MASSAAQTSFPIDLNLTGTHVLITGSSGLIGRVVVQAFLSAGANVTAVDLVAGPTHDNQHCLSVPGTDITASSEVDAAFTAAEAKFGPVEVCVALASLDLSVLPQSESLADMDPEVWQRVMNVNVGGTFMTCRRWLQGLRAAASIPEKAKKLKNVSLVIMGSESGRFGVRTQAAYAAGKSAVQEGLLKSLAQDAPRIWSTARVNAVAPGTVDTERLWEEKKRYGEEWLWKEAIAT